MKFTVGLAGLVGLALVVIALQFVPACPEPMPITRLQLGEFVVGAWLLITSHLSLWLVRFP